MTTRYALIMLLMLFAAPVIAAGPVVPGTSLQDTDKSDKANDKSGTDANKKDTNKTSTKADDKDNNKAKDDDEPYTSVIVDATGFKVERDHSPKILQEDGMAVYGTQNVDPDYVDEYGIADYAYTLADAQKDEKAGKKPLIIKASKQADNKFNVVISDEDAKKLIEADKKGHFLKGYHVILIHDKPNK